MNKFTIQQLQQMRESEDRVEFKAGEGGNVSYDGRGKTNPKDRRRCILGYKLSDRYYEIAKNVGTAEDERKDDTVNVPVNDTVNLSQLTERQEKIYHIIKDGTINDTANVPINVPINAATLATMFNVSEKTIKRDLYVLRDLNLIKYVGSNKTGHWEVIVN